MIISDAQQRNVILISTINEVKSLDICSRSYVVLPRCSFRTQVLISSVARTGWLLNTHRRNLLKNCSHSQGGSLIHTVPLFQRPSLQWLLYVGYKSPTALPQFRTSLKGHCHSTAPHRISLCSHHITVQLFSLHDLISSLPCRCCSKSAPQQTLCMQISVS